MTERPHGFDDLDPEIVRSAFRQARRESNRAGLRLTPAERMRWLVETETWVEQVARERSKPQPGITRG